MPDGLLTALTVVVLGLVATNLVVSLRRALAAGGRAETVLLVRGLRPRHVLPAVPVIALVVGIYALLALFPPLRFGWWTAIGGQGNIVFGSTDQTRGTILELLVPIVFVVLLVPALPLLVLAEERRFRFGAETWSTRRRIGRALQFGLFHLFVGIPIAAGLGLAVTGLWLTWVYVHRFSRTGDPREALLESGRSHLGYDLVVVGLVVAALTLGGCAGGGGDHLVVTSAAFRAGGELPERFSCEGDNTSPPLAWTGVPDAAVAQAVVLDDPDAPSGDFTHWVLVRLTPDRRSLGEGETPGGAVVGLSSSDAATYVGPCPPNGQRHRYRFTVHALSTQVDVGPTTPPATARAAIDAATIRAGTLEVRFGR